jgi:hypothetical protein
MVMRRENESCDANHLLLDPSPIKLQPKQVKRWLLWALKKCKTCNNPEASLS